MNDEVVLELTAAIRELAAVLRPGAGGYITIRVIHNTAVSGRGGGAGGANLSGSGGAGGAYLSTFKSHSYQVEI